MNVCTNAVGTMLLEIKYNKLDHVPSLVSVVWMTKIIEGKRSEKVGNSLFEVNPKRHGDDTNVAGCWSDDSRFTDCSFRIDVKDTRATD